MQGEQMETYLDPCVGLGLGGGHGPPVAFHVCSQVSYPGVQLPLTGAEDDNGVQADACGGHFKRIRVQPTAQANQPRGR